jgi:hypothetical protein
MGAITALPTRAAEPAYTPPKSEWKSLFNGRDLSGWDKYLATPKGSEPLVANIDPKGVFTITNLNGEGVVHVSGDGYGAITTQEEFTKFIRSEIDKYANVVKATGMKPQ